MAAGRAWLRFAMMAARRGNPIPAGRSIRSLDAMSSPRELRVVREPAISESEWAAFISARPDFEAAHDAAGQSPTGQTLALGNGMTFWLGHSDGPFPVAWTPDGIHFLDSDHEVDALAQEVADHFRGEVQDW